MTTDEDGAATSTLLAFSGHTSGIAGPLGRTAGQQLMLTRFGQSVLAAIEEIPRI